MATSADIQSYNSDLDYFEQYHQQREHHPSNLPALGHGIAGGVGAAASNLAIYPLNLMITRAQTAQKNSAKGGGGSRAKEQESIFSVARKIYDRDGIAGLYAGCGIDTAKTMADSFLFFMAYNSVRQYRLRAHHGGDRRHLPVLDELAVGFVAGIFSKFFTAPLSNIVTRLQTSEDNKSQNVASIVETIRREKGITGLWTGYSANFITTLNPSLTFFFFEFLKSATLPKDQRANPPASATFLLSAISKSLASAATYPFSLAKSRAQTRKSAPPPVDPEKAADSVEAALHQAKLAAQNSILGIVAQIVRDDGIAGLYQGVQLEVLKGFISHGLTMVIKDQVHAVIVRVYLLLMRLLKRSSVPSPAKVVQSVMPDAGSANEFATSIFDEVKDTTETIANKAADVSKDAVDGVGELVGRVVGDKSGKK